MSLSLVYTEHRPPGNSLPHLVLPDGCADLVFDIKDAWQSGSTPADIVGPMSSANVLEVRNAIEIVGVRLRPGAIAAFSGWPASIKSSAGKCNCRRSDVDSR